MSFLPVALAIGGTLFSAYGSYRSGQAQQAAMDYNAKVAKQEALAAQQKAAADERRQREASARDLAEQRNLFGFSGVSTEGTPLMVMAESAANAELDALNIRYAGELERQRKVNEAKMYRYQGKQAYKAGMIGAGTSLLTGIGNIGIYKKWGTTSPSVPGLDTKK